MITVKIFQVSVPSGAVLPLAKALAAASPKLGRDSIRVASELFAEGHTAEEPYLFEVEVAENLPALREACEACGFVVVED